MSNFKLPRYEDLYLYHLHVLIAALEQRGVEGDRTGTGTARMFGTQMRCDLREDFPLLTSKQVFTRGIIEELLWFLRGETNIKPLNDVGVHIWDEWADASGELGPVYGAQWRDWNGEGIDQLYELVCELRNNPNSRRMIVNAWNPSVLPSTAMSPAMNAARGNQALPPCHTMFQCFSQEMTAEERARYPGQTRWLDLQLYQRSADWFIGVPFNAVSYSLLLMLLAHHVGMAPRFFIHTFGDFHLYSNHITQAREQVGRTPKPQRPYVTLSHDADTPLEQVKASDIEIGNYHSHPAIKAPVAV